MNPLLPELFVLQGFSVRKNKSAKPFVSTVSHFCGAGDRTRTGTLSLAVDFESTTSTNSITPAGALDWVTGVLYTTKGKIARGNFVFFIRNENKLKARQRMLPCFFLMLRDFHRWLL